MACCICGVKLLDLEGRMIQTAFDSDEIKQMCEGQNNTLFVLKSNKIIQLDCSTTQFKRKPGWTMTVQVHSYLDYIGSTNTLIVKEPLRHDLNVRFKVHAISCESGQILWSVEQDDVMLVRDIPKCKGILGVYQSIAQSQIQVICPKTGLCVQRISLTAIGYSFGKVRDIVVSKKGILFILCNNDVSLDPTSILYGTSQQQNKRKRLRVYIISI